MIKHGCGTDQEQPSLRQDSTGTSHNTDLSLLTRLATVNSSGESSTVSIRLTTTAALRKQHLLSSVGISA